MEAYLKSCNMILNDSNNPIFVGFSNDYLIQIHDFKPFMTDELIKHQSLNKDHVEALMLLGGIRAADRIAKVIDAEVMRTTIQFSQNKLHELFGFKRFADFLDKSDLAPMSRAEFDVRRPAFESEGEKLFNLYNDLGISFRQRRLLGTGNVAVEGETLIIKEGDGEKAIPLTDRALILETIKSLADANAEKAKQITRGKSDLRRLQDDIYELEERQGNMPGKNLSPLDKAHAVAVGGLSALIAEVEKATLIHCGQYAEQSFSVLAEKVRQLNQLILEKTGFENADLTISDDAEERAAALLDDE